MILKLCPGSPTELAARVVPEFSSLTLMVNNESPVPAQFAVDDQVRLEFTWPGSNGKPVYLDVTVVFCFETEALKNWVAVAVSPSQQALIHHLRYLCRHHKSEYGKLFHQLVNDFGYPNLR